MLLPPADGALRSHEALRSICLAQALECQKISDELLGVLREFNCAWQERILRPVQCVRGIVEASPWIVNAIALSRDIGETCGPPQPAKLRHIRQDVARFKSPRLLSACTRDQPNSGGASGFWRCADPSAFCTPAASCLPDPRACAEA